MHQSLSGLFLPLSVSPARPRRTFGYTVGWPLFCPRLSPLPLLLLPNLRLPPDPFSLFLFLLARASARALSFLFLPVVSAISLTGLPNQGSAWFLPFAVVPYRFSGHGAWRQRTAYRHGSHARTPPGPDRQSCAAPRLTANGKSQQPTGRDPIEDGLSSRRRRSTGPR